MGAEVDTHFGQRCIGFGTFKAASFAVFVVTEEPGRQSINGLGAPGRIQPDQDRRVVGDFRMLFQVGPQFTFSHCHYCSPLGRTFGTGSTPT